jgi:putative transcriptional regulator
MTEVTVHDSICQVCYIFCRRDISHRQDICSKLSREAMIRVQIDKLLRERERTFYWLAKETGVSHTTLWRLKKDKAQGITFNTLRSVCEALKCQPGDVLKLGRKKSSRGR